MGLNKIFLLQEMIKTENYTPEEKNNNRFFKINTFSTADCEIKS